MRFSRSFICYFVTQQQRKCRPRPTATTCPSSPSLARMSAHVVRALVPSFVPHQFLLTDGTSPFCARGHCRNALPTARLCMCVCARARSRFVAQIREIHATRLRYRCRTHLPAFKGSPTYLLTGNEPSVFD